MLISKLDKLETKLKNDYIKILRLYDLLPLNSADKITTVIPVV